MSTTSGRTMASEKTKTAGKGEAVKIGEGACRGNQSIKYIYEADSRWMADEIKSHINLINDRLERIPPGAVSGDYSIEAQAGDEKLSDFDRKDDRFLWCLPNRSFLVA